MTNKPKATAKPAPKSAPKAATPPPAKKPATLRDKVAARKRALDEI